MIKVNFPIEIPGDHFIPISGYTWKIFIGSE